MEHYLNDIQKHIKQHMGDVFPLIDEDCGQLESIQDGQDQYPVTFPCVLIGTPDVTWRTLKPSNLQQGTAMVTVRMAMDCYDDTHLGSTQEDKIQERMELASQLNGWLHGWVFEGCSRPLLRNRSRQYSLPGGIKVYETVYTTETEENVQKPAEPVP